MFTPLKSDIVNMLAMHTDSLARFSVPPNLDDCEIWAMANHKFGVTVGTRIFEAHEEGYIKRRRWENTYLRHWIEELHEQAKEKPVYTQYKWEKSLGPHHVNPFMPHDVKKNVKGKPFIESTLGYMLASALWVHKNVSPIRQLRMFGFSLDGTNEYAWQKPNGLYFIGRLEEAGVQIYVPPESKLFHSAFESGQYGRLENLGPLKKNVSYGQL